MEGFFGRMKNEMFHHRDWDDVTYEEFEGLIAHFMRSGTRRIRTTLTQIRPLGNCGRGMSARQCI